MKELISAKKVRNVYKMQYLEAKFPVACRMGRRR